MLEHVLVCTSTCVARGILGNILLAPSEEWRSHVAGPLSTFVELEPNLCTTHATDVQSTCVIGVAPRLGARPVWRGTVQGPYLHVEKRWVVRWYPRRGAQPLLVRHTYGRQAP